MHQPISFLRSLCATTAAAALTIFPCQAQQNDQPLPKKLPTGLEATLFAAPPMVNYPTFLAATESGELFVSVDKNGSIDRQPGRGFIYKLADKDGDGKAETKTVFSADVTSARGLAIDGDTVICLHPPEVEAFRDKDGDGVAEERTVLVKGVGFTLKDRPPDHTSNGVTLGIDGWLYLAIGDFGFMEAEGRDGRKLQLRGGGVVRVRPDGTELELFCRGTRNIYEVAVDPWLNCFARDNTNDGDGWDTRVEVYFYGGHLGYPSLFKRFPDETLPVLGIYGGGSGVGGVYVQEKGFDWPQGYDDCLYTCDWGRSAVYRHPAKDAHGSFEISQDTLCELERVTDMKTDALGRAYLASWKGATFTYNGENAGYIVQVCPPSRRAAKLPKPLKQHSARELADCMKSGSHTWRLSAQRELLRRSATDRSQALPELQKIAADASLSVPQRVAALFTAKQIAGASLNAWLIGRVADPSLREFALRALADRIGEGKDVPTAVFAGALSDPSDHVKIQAVAGLSRLGRVEAADGLLGLAIQPGDAAPSAGPAAATDLRRTVPHLASRALIHLKASAACLNALRSKDAPRQAAALRVLRHLHDPEIVRALTNMLLTENSADPALRAGLVTALVRLFHREGPWNAENWGTRPDTSGPYYKRETWEMSPEIEKALGAYATGADAAGRAHLQNELSRHSVVMKSLPLVQTAVDPQWAKDQEVLARAMKRMTTVRQGDIGTLDPQDVTARTLAVLNSGKADPKKGQRVFTDQGCAACHTTGKNDAPKGPNLHDIAARYKPEELITSILNPNATVSQGFPTHTVTTKDGHVFSGFILKEGGDELVLRNMAAVTQLIPASQIAKREKSDNISSMTPGLISTLKPEDLADLLEYFRSLAKK